MSGIESALAITGVALAGFQILLSTIDHFDKGLENYQDWRKYRHRYENFRTGFHRQQIYFRQHLEALLTPIVKSDHDLNQMLNNPDNPLWDDEELKLRFKQRLSGESELLIYMSSLKGINDVREKIRRKFEMSSDKDQKAQENLTVRELINYEISRMSFVLGTRRRNKLMEELECHINGLERILGNCDKLRPGRGKREEDALPVYFDTFREQATKLHEAICRSMRCACPGLHSSQLLLWRSYDKILDMFNAGALIFKVYFPRKSQKWSQNSKVVPPENDWFASDIQMAKRSNIPNHERDIEISERPGVPVRAFEIDDLCAALDIVKDSTYCLGYLLSSDGKPLVIHKSEESFVPPSVVRKVVKLRELIQQRQESAFKTVARARLPRAKRLLVAIKMVEIVLQLFDTPWLRDNWDKDDIYFFEDNKGIIYYDKPFLVSNFRSPMATSQDHHRPDSLDAAMSPVNEMHAYKRTKAVLLSLGIVILELWFNQPFESCGWRKDFLSPNGEETYFTRLSTALIWQELALEEGGVRLHDLTDACINSSFGMTRPDLREREVQMSIYTRVAEPLKELIKYFE